MSRPDDSLLTEGELRRAAQDVQAMLAASARPLVLIGAGARTASGQGRLVRLVERLGIPVLTTWPGIGLVGADHPLHLGRPGPLAPRGVNFALQSADALLCLGTRLDLATTGYDPKDFGRNARKAVVEIDPNELEKLVGVADIPILADVRVFIDALEQAVAAAPLSVDPRWVDRCRALERAFPVVLDRHRTPGREISTYHFTEVLSEVLSPDDILALCSSGLAIEIVLLCLRVATGARVSFTTALGAMGYGPPSAIGACLAAGGARTICVDGDGGLQLNVQELETIRRLDLPIKLFVLANGGYASIRASQQRWFQRLHGVDAASGVTLPPLAGVAGAYGLPYRCLSGTEPLAPQMRALLDERGPLLCEVPMLCDEAREPGQLSEPLPDGGFRSRPIEDLVPLLSRAELSAGLATDPAEWR